MLVVTRAIFPSLGPSTRGAALVRAREGIRSSAAGAAAGARAKVRRKLSKQIISLIMCQMLVVQPVNQSRIL